MHTIPELGTSVPAFLAKLWKLVEDPETDDLICWSPVSTFILLFIYNHLISLYATHIQNPNPPVDVSFHRGDYLFAMVMSHERIN